MAKKGIAAFLLVVIAAWAEMTMAPMFAMHTGHMRSGHEMAVMPGHNHAGHSHVEMASGLPCCPGLHKMQAVAVLAMFADAPGCDDPHSCCFRQGPQSVPAPARVARESARGVVLAARMEASPVPRARRAVTDISVELSPPVAVFGMALRV